MPEQKTIKRAKKAKREGKSPTTQAGEFVREEFHHIREGKHGARSAKQAVAIGLSKARRAGVDLPPPENGKASEKTRKSAERAPVPSNSGRRGQGEPAKRKPSAKRSRASHRALEREGTAAASHQAISKQAHAAARRRTAADRSESAKKAAETKGPKVRHEAAEKAVRTKGHAGLARAARKAARTRAARRHKND